MEGSVRRNIALKLKTSSTQKPPDSKRPREKEEDSLEVDKPVIPPTTNATLTIPSVVPRPMEGVAPGLRWDYKVNLIGRAVQDPLLHICEICSLPVLIYGRMKRCRHAFCRDCSKKAAGGCPKCREGDQVFEEATMGNVYICTNGGGRYDNKGCGRSYLSQRDLEAHIVYRHKEKLPSTLMPSVAVSGTPIPPFPIPPPFAFQPHPELGLPPPVGMAPPTMATPHPTFSLAAGTLPSAPPHMSMAPSQPLHPPLIPAVTPIVSVPQFPAPQQPSTLPSTWSTATGFK